MAVDLRPLLKLSAAAASSTAVSTAAAVIAEQQDCRPAYEPLA